MIIDGKKIADKVKENVAKEVARCKELYKRTPRLELILVGDDPNSVSYVNGKAKDSAIVGIECHISRLPQETSQEELLRLIEEFNSNDDVDAILVQLPLPKHIDEAVIIDAIDPAKDCDGFHSINVANLWLNRPHIVPCTPRGIMHLLRHAGVEIEGKHAVIVGRGNIVGKPMAKVLMDNHATVTICHSRTPHLADYTRSADIVIAAAGVTKLIKRDMIKPGAVVIDVAINYNPFNGRICGDVDFAECEPICSAISPVPGGVGPMTKACLMENTLECFLNRQKQERES